MTLHTRLISPTALLVVIMIAITLTCWVVLRAMQNDAATLAEEYEEARVIDNARASLARARSELRRRSPSPPDILPHLADIRVHLTTFVEIQEQQEGADEAHHEREQDVAGDIISSVGTIAERLRTTQEVPDLVPDALHTLDHADALLVLLSEEANAVAGEAVRNSAGILQRGTIIIIACCAVGAIAALVVGYIQYLTIMGSINALRERARGTLRRARIDRTAQGDLYARFTEDFAGIVRELETMYDTLEERVHMASRELVQAERLASVGYLAAGVAHEINNPLSSILGYTELVLRRLNDRDDAEVVESLDVVRQEALRCKAIVEKLLSLARRPDEGASSCDLVQCVRDVIEITRGMQTTGHRTITFNDGAAPLLVPLSDVELKQVLLNLLVNAVESTDPGSGHVEILTDRSAGRAVVEIRDNGCGIADADRLRLFEPFFSRKRGAGQGTGLGLSIVHAIIRDHGGTITAFSDGPGLGARFVAALPLFEATHA